MKIAFRKKERQVDILKDKVSTKEMTINDFKMRLGLL